MKNQEIEKYLYILDFHCSMINTIIKEIERIKVVVMIVKINPDKVQFAFSAIFD